MNRELLDRFGSKTNKCNHKKADSDEGYETGSWTTRCGRLDVAESSATAQTYGCAEDSRRSRIIGAPVALGNVNSLICS
jgi:hypothetical protein